MWTVPSRIVGALAIPLLTVLMAGCGGMSEDEARNDVHERVDKLAERIGTSSRVRGEGAAGMDPKASTLGYSYRVRVDVDPRRRWVNSAGRLPTRCATTAGPSTTTRT